MRICQGNQGQDGLENPLFGQGACKWCLSPVSPKALRPRHDSESIEHVIPITGRSLSQSSDGKVSKGLPLSEAAHLSSSQCSTPSVVGCCRQRHSESSASSVAVKLRWCGVSRAITRMSPGRRPEQLPGQWIFACPSWSSACTSNERWDWLLLGTLIRSRSLQEHVECPYLSHPCLAVSVATCNCIAGSARHVLGPDTGT